VIEMRDWCPMNLYVLVISITNVIFELDCKNKWRVILAVISLIDQNMAP